MKTAIYITILLLFAACTSTKIASDTSREATRVEYRDRLRTDSVFVWLRDSVHIRERSDTVFVEKFKTQIAYRDRLRVDTVSVTDTVKITRLETVTEEVNRLTGWQWFQLWFGRIAAALTLVYILIKRHLK
jgi:hypothetical protein